MCSVRMPKRVVPHSNKSAIWQGHGAPCHYARRFRMITLLAFIGAIALLVLFHEFGHYWVARRYGVKVLRFSVGFGRVIYSKRFADGDTEWVISAIPLGGYVKMVDEREEMVAPEDLPYAFNRKPVLQRMAIVVAGPLANLLLAIVLYWAMFLYGVPEHRPIQHDGQQQI